MLRSVFALLLVALTAANSSLYWFELYDLLDSEIARSTIVEQAKAYIQQNAKRPNITFVKSGSMVLQVASQHAAFELELDMVSADSFDSRVHTLIHQVGPNLHYPIEILLAGLDALARSVYVRRLDLAVQICQNMGVDVNESSLMVTDLVNKHTITKLQMMLKGEIQFSPSKANGLLSQQGKLSDENKDK